MPLEQEALLFRASRAKAALLLLGCCAFVAMGFFIVGNEPLIGWLCMGFFGLGIPVSLLMLFSNRTTLKLTHKGIEVGTLFNVQRIPWRHVASFRIGQIHGARMIAIVYRPGGAGQTARRLAKSMTGMEGAIPNNYAVSIDKLLAHLNDWHARYG
jgi:hypothetical protein